MQLWRRCARDIWRSSLPLGAKLELLVLYFGVRKFATHWVSLGFFCTLVPLSIFTPEVKRLLWPLPRCLWPPDTHGYLQTVASGLSIFGIFASAEVHGL